MIRIRFWGILCSIILPGNVRYSYIAVRWRSILLGHIRSAWKAPSSSPMSSCRLTSTSLMCEGGQIEESQASQHARCIFP